MQLFHTGCTNASMQVVEDHRLLSDEELNRLMWHLLVNLMNAVMMGCMASLCDESAKINSHWSHFNNEMSAELHFAAIGSEWQWQSNESDHRKHAQHVGMSIVDAAKATAEQRCTGGRLEINSDFGKSPAENHACQLTLKDSHQCNLGRPPAKNHSRSALFL